ncbi:hypothetical protein [Proteiniphilum sp. X52]|uniref:hypothetical protein n=1 Tax=Proteiniphilum sp. X52 TaxID=2382159 RepID=UPI0011CE5D9D|nr:hypothetical protein [Proteiniphilum sp. X52]
MQTDFPTKRTSRDALKDKTEEERTAILQHNREQYIMRSKRANEVYTIKTKSHPIGRSLAIQLHKTYVSLIGNHKNTGIPNISKDGYTAVFRCVVGDEIWNFSTRNPLGAFKELTDLCEDIANDVKENKKDINEDEYVRRLEELMNAKSL